VHAERAILAHFACTSEFLWPNYVHAQRNYKLGNCYSGRKNSIVCITPGGGRSSDPLWPSLRELQTLLWSGACSLSDLRLQRAHPTPVISVDSSRFKRPCCRDRLLRPNPKRLASPLPLQHPLLYLGMGCRLLSTVFDLIHIGRAFRKSRTEDSI
jgi:hypothetical protein